MSERRRHNTDRMFDFSETPLGGFLPEGNYDMRIASLEKGYTRERNLLKFTMELRVLEPASMMGKGHYETLVFGTAPFDPGESQNPEFVAYAHLDDPDCEDPINMRVNNNIQLFKQLMHFAGIDMNGSVNMDDMIAVCNGGELRVGMRLRVEEQATGRYAGTIRNRISHCYEIGREAPGFASNPRQSQRRGVRQESPGAPAGRRVRNEQPERMQQALANPTTRQQLIEEMGESAFQDEGQLVMDAAGPPTPSRVVGSETD